MGIFSTDEAWDSHYGGLQEKAEKWEDMMRKGPDGFRPCPVCGKALTRRDIEFFDTDGEPIGELGDMVDMEDVMSVRNIESSFGMDTPLEELEEHERRDFKNNWKDMVEAADIMSIQCSCGYSMFVFNDKLDKEFPERGWLEEFGEIVNRRMGE